MELIKNAHGKFIFNVKNKSKLDYNGPVNDYNAALMHLIVNNKTSVLFKSRLEIEIDTNDISINGDYFVYNYKLCSLDDIIQNIKCMNNIEMKILLHDEEFKDSNFIKHLAMYDQLILQFRFKKIPDIIIVDYDSIILDLSVIELQRWRNNTKTKNYIYIDGQCKKL